MQTGMTLGQLGMAARGVQADVALKRSAAAERVFVNNSFLNIDVCTFLEKDEPLREKLISWLRKAEQTQGWQRFESCVTDIIDPSRSARIGPKESDDDDRDTRGGLGLFDSIREAEEMELWKLKGDSESISIHSLYKQHEEANNQQDHKAGQGLGWQGKATSSNHQHSGLFWTPIDIRVDENLKVSFPTPNLLLKDEGSQACIRAFVERLLPELDWFWPEPSGARRERKVNLGMLKLREGKETLVTFTDTDGDVVSLVYDHSRTVVEETVNGKIAVQNVKYFILFPDTCGYRDVGGHGKMLATTFWEVSERLRRVFPRVKTLRGRDLQVHIKAQKYYFHREEAGEKMGSYHREGTDDDHISVASCVCLEQHNVISTLHCKELKSDVWQSQKYVIGSDLPVSHSLQPDGLWMMDNNNKAHALSWQRFAQNLDSTRLILCCFLVDPDHHVESMTRFALRHFVPEDFPDVVVDEINGFLGWANTDEAYQRKSHILLRNRHENIDVRENPANFYRSNRRVRTCNLD